MQATSSKHQKDNNNIHKILSLHSPQHTNITTNKHSNFQHLLLHANISPSFRNKRIPSAQDNYSYSSNQNLKIHRVDSSPCNNNLNANKHNEKLKRRKSQYINSSSSVGCIDKGDHNNVGIGVGVTGGVKKKQSKSINSLNTCGGNNSNSNNLNNINGINNSNTNIINMSAPNILTSMVASTPSNSNNMMMIKQSSLLSSSNANTFNNNNSSNNNNTINPSNIIFQMNNLKNEYKQLKLAYQQLIQEKINNSQKMSIIKQENRKLQAELEMALSKMVVSTNRGISSYRSNSNNNTHISSNNNNNIQHQQLILTIQQLQQQNNKLIKQTRHQQQQLERIKKQCYKLLQAEKFKSHKLELLLEEKGMYLGYVDREIVEMKKGSGINGVINRQKNMVMGIGEGEGDSNDNNQQIKYKEDQFFSKVQLINNHNNKSNKNNVGNNNNDKNTEQISQLSSLALIKNNTISSSKQLLQKKNQQPLIHSTPKLVNQRNNKMALMKEEENDINRNDISNKLQEGSLFISQDRQQEESSYYEYEENCIASNNQLSNKYDSTNPYNNPHNNTSTNTYNNNINNQSQFISISLTSVMENSTEQQQLIFQQQLNNNCVSNKDNYSTKNLIIPELEFYQTQSTETVMNVHVNVNNSNNSSNGNNSSSNGNNVLGSNNNLINVNANANAGNKIVKANHHDKQVSSSSRRGEKNVNNTNKNNINNNNNNNNSDYNIINNNNDTKQKQKQKQRQKQKQKQRQKQKQNPPPSKKTRKQITQKLQLTNINYTDKQPLLLLYNLKTPINNNTNNNNDNKKSSTTTTTTTKHKNSKSKKKQQDKQNNVNFYGRENSQNITNGNVVRNMKKKDKQNQKEKSHSVYYK